MSRRVLTDAMWNMILKVLPVLMGRPGNDNRNFIEAVLWIMRTGAQWRDLPKDFGPWKTVYNRCNNWAKKGYLKSIFDVVKKKKSDQRNFQLMDRI